MNHKATLFLACTIALPVVSLSTDAFSGRIKYYAPSELSQLCRSNNGTFMPPTPEQPGYGCLGSRGGIIVCGGPGKWSKRCDAYEFRTIRGVRKHSGGKGFVLLDR
jgi:hypothetical protein